MSVTNRAALAPRIFAKLYFVICLIRLTAGDAINAEN